MRSRLIIFLPLLLWWPCYGQSLSTNLSSVRFILNTVDESMVFGYKNNPAHLASVHYATAGFFSERKYLLSELNFHSLVAAINTGGGGFGFFLDYRGSPLYNESKVSLAYGKTLGNTLQGGLQVNWNSISASSYGKSSLFTFTIGLACQVSEKLQARVVVEENRKKFGTESKEEWPALYSLGMLYNVSDKFSFGGEILKWQNQPLQFITACEYKPVQKIKWVAGISIPNANTFIGIVYQLRTLQLGIYTQHHMQLGFSPSVSISTSITKREK